MYSAGWQQRSQSTTSLQVQEKKIAIEPGGHRIPLEVDFQSFGWCMAWRRFLLGINNTTLEQPRKLSPKIAIFSQIWFSQSSVASNLLIPYKTQTILQVAVRRTKGKPQKKAASSQRLPQHHENGFRRWLGTRSQGPCLSLYKYGNSRLLLLQSHSPIAESIFLHLGRG